MDSGLSLAEFWLIRSGNTGLLLTSRIVSVHSEVNRVCNWIAACSELQAVSPRSQAAGTQIEDIPSVRAERGVETKVVIGVCVARSIGRSRKARNRRDRRGMDDDRRRRDIVAIRVAELELDGERGATFDRSALVEKRTDDVFDILIRREATATRAGDAIAAVLACNGMGTHRERGRSERRLTGG